MDDSQITRFASSAPGQSNAAVYRWNGDLVSQRELPYLGDSATLKQFPQNSLYALSFDHYQNDVLTKLSPNFDVIWQINTSSKKEDFRLFGDNSWDKSVGIQFWREEYLRDPIINVGCQRSYDG